MTHSNVLNDRISLNIPADDIQAIQGALQVLDEKLSPHLVDLGVDERRQLPKLGPRTLDFVTHALSLARAMPQYKPGYVDLDEFGRDLDAIGVLRDLLHPLTRLTDMVGDSHMLAGSEAYSAALSYYEAVKAAAKRGMPDAEMAAAALAERYPARAPSRSTTAAAKSAIVTPKE